MKNTLRESENSNLSTSFGKLRTFQKILFKKIGRLYIPSLLIFFICLIFSLSNTTAQPLKGVVVYQNSAYKSADKKIMPVPNAFVYSIQGNATTDKSDPKDGSFELLFSGLKMGTLVEVMAKYQDLVITNREVLKQAAVLGRLSDVRIEMRNSKELEEEKRMARQVIEKEIKGRYERRVKVIEDRSNLMASTIDSLQKELKRKISSPEEALSILYELQEKADAEVIAFTSKLVKQNLDFASKRYIEVYEAIFIKKDPALALDIFSKVDFQQEIQEGIKKEKAFIEQAQTERQTIEKKYAELELYIAQMYAIGDYQKTDSLYQIRIKFDSSLQVLNNYTQFLFDIGELTKARKINECVRKFSQQSNYSLDTEGVAWGLYHFDAILSLDEDTTACKVCQTAIPLFEELSKKDSNYRIYTARLLSDLGQCRYLQRKMSEAVIHYEKALEIYNFKPDPSKVTDYQHYKSFALAGLSNCLGTMKNFDTAKVLIQEAIGIQKQLRQKDSLKHGYYLGLFINNLVSLYGKSEDDEKEVETAKQGVQLMTSIGIHKSKAIKREYVRLMMNLSYALVNLEQLIEAKDTLNKIQKIVERSLSTDETKFYGNIWINTYKILLIIAFDTENYDEGLQVCDQVITRLETPLTGNSLDDTNSKAYFTMFKGVLYFYKKDIQYSVNQYNKAIQLYETNKNWREASDCDNRALSQFKRMNQDERQKYMNDIKIFLEKLDFHSEQLKPFNSTLAADYKKKYMEYKAFWGL